MKKVKPFLLAYSSMDFCGYKKQIVCTYAGKVPGRLLALNALEWLLMLKEGVLEEYDPYS